MLRLVVVLGLIVGCAQRPAPFPMPPTQPAAAVLGETWKLDSKVLGETRVINVYVPPDYAKSSDRYPVLYMPDGGMKEDFPHIVGSVDVSTKNAIIRPVIVVGIENTERRRDLLSASVVPEEQQMAPLAGGSDRFRQFLRDELKPTIERRYRATRESAIVGESAAGLFVVETFLVEPTLFDAYIAADPSVWWNEETLVRDAAVQLSDWTAGPKYFYFASANEERNNRAIDVLVSALRSIKPAGVTWVHEPMPHEGHGTVFPTAALHGIRKVFAPLSEP